MIENLKTTRYRNGGQIPNVTTDNTGWGNLTTGAWSYYNNAVSNNAIYGKLYNWYTTKGDTLCPTGWHVPTDAEWTTLTNYLGGEGVAGGKMKATGTAYWNDPNTGAINSSGFSALPGGYRLNGGGSFGSIRDDAFFWSATEYDNYNAGGLRLDKRNGTVGRFYNGSKSVGASVRCLRDYAMDATKTDTASLSNRIDLKLTKTDTASLSNRIDLKLTKTDTASLSNRIDLKLTKTDTTSLSNRIDAKLNRSDFPSGTNTGNILYWNGTSWVNLAPGQPGQVISMSSTGIPSWSGAAYSTLTTSSVSSITYTSVSAGGNISSDGGATVSARGLVYITSTNPTLSNTVLTIGSGTGIFSGTISGLTPNTTYYVRAYATNSAGTAYGNEVSFTTLSSVTDIDGNIYNTVQIGNQVWMSENLKTSRYRNGGSIPNVTDNTAWSNLTTGAWSYYNNADSNNAIYGKLYNWYTTKGDTLCPTGWGVPTDAELTILSDFLGGLNVAGGKMKATGTAYWLSQSAGTDNSSGFSGLPGGYRRGDNGSFNFIRDNAFFWSATENGYNNAWFRYLHYNFGNVFRNNGSKSVGAPVRCLRD